jgi:nitrogen regulatory protein P-II 1
MDLKKVLAIVRNDMIEHVESRLIQLGVPGITIARVKGFGEYSNFFTHDWLSAYVRIEIFTDAAQVQQIVDAILEAAHTGTAGDGIVSVLPVDSLYRIRDHHKLSSRHGSQTAQEGAIGRTHAI